MMNVVVVDDRKLIRKGIVSLLMKSQLNIGKIAEFGNGHDVLEFLRSTPADLVITDIRMPQMDGIALMEQAKKLEQSPKFIVLSEYDDFKYAQKSMEHGARAYILKPVDKIELIKVIAKIEEEINREKGFHQKENQILDKEKKLMQEELRLALLDSIHSDGMVERLEQKGFWFSNSPFYVSLILYKETEYPQGNSLLLTGFHQVIRDYSTGLAEPHITLELGKMSMVITQSQEQAHELVKCVNQSEQNAVAAVSDLIASCRDIRFGYLQALENLKYRYIYPEKELIMPSDISALHADSPLPAEEIERLCLLIGSGKMDLLDDMVSNIFNKRFVIENKIEYLEGTVKAFYNSLAGIVSVLSYKWSDELKKYDKLNDIYNFDSMKEYLSSAVDFVHIIDHYVAAMKSAYHNNGEIEKAIEFMEKNYAKNLSLTVVSNYVSMNYSYFSHLFRVKTGVSFVEYLRKIRITKSMELLCASQSKKISEISEEVGFNSYKQFSRTFVETVGISPMEFREQKMTMARILEQSNPK